jgi:hypothetical protein
LSSSSPTTLPHPERVRLELGFVQEDAVVAAPAAPE